MENFNPYSMEKAREEAEKIKKIISDGRANNYEESESISDKEVPDSNFGADYKIISENVSKEIRAKYLMKVANPFHQERRTEKASLEFMHPQVLEFLEGKKRFFPDSKLTVRYIDRKNREIETKWRLDEYLKRIGLFADKKNGIKPFDRFRELIRSEDDIEAVMRDTHRKIIQERIEKGYSFDQSLERKAMLSRAGKNERENQLRTQYEEDPFFTRILEGSDYVFPVELPIHHDYMDAIDVLVEIDISELDDEWTEEPMYIGVQRTLLSEESERLKEKREKIENQPLWYLPEYPERNPVLRVLYREDPTEYYLDNRTSRMEMLGEITREENLANPKRAQERGIKLLRADRVLLGKTEKEVRENFSGKNAKENRELAKCKMIGKTLDVLYQALDKLIEYQGDKSFPAHLQKTYIRYERTIRKIISIIEEDNDLSRDKIQHLLNN